MIEHDPLDVLRDALRGEPMVPLSDDQVAAIVQRAMATPPTKRALSRSRRRRRQWFVGVGVVVGLGAGGGLAAAVLNKGHVSHPEGGVACRATTDPNSSAVVVDLNADPISACEAVWADHRLPDGDHPESNTGQVPPLVACVSIGGGIDVLPAMPDDTCETLGLRSADIAAAVADPAASLLDQLVDDPPTCLAASDAGARARAVLDELGLTSWTVVVRPSVQPDQVCSFPSVDSNLSSVFITPVAAAPEESQPEGTS